jgi:sorbitol-specific phosphotransferase system component IIBC
MATHEQYILHVTAGATYDTSKHQDVLVNSEKPVDVSSDLIDARIHMRIKDYRGTLRALAYPHPPMVEVLPASLLSRPATAFISPSHYHALLLTTHPQAYLKAPRKRLLTSRLPNTHTTATRSPSPSPPSKTSRATNSSSETTLITQYAIAYPRCLTRRLE